MKKNFLLLAALAVSGMAFSQVGINNNLPKATLDVTAKNTDGTTPEGIIAPRLTGDQIRGGNAQYTALQNGALVYATAADSAPAGQTSNITSPGYYYYDGAVAVQKWIKLGADTTDDAWVNGTAQVLLGTKSDGTARTAGTDFVALDNGNVGIGLAAPGNKLEVTGTNPLKLNGLQTGVAGDQLLSVNGNGVVRQIVASTLIASAGLDNTNDAWVNGTAQVLLGTKSDGSARTVGTDFVALDNGNVGIGLPTPGTKLEITSTGTNNPLKLNNLQTGANTDKILTVDASGNVKQVSPAVGVVGLLTNSGNIIGTTQVVIPQGTTSDLPGATFTISPTVNVRVIVTISAIGLPNAAGSPVQGSINLVQNGTIIASQYYSAADASAAVTQLGNFSTISRVVDLTPGTYTFKLSAKSWLNDTKFNGDAFPLYGGSIATDTVAQKSSIGYQVYTR